MQQIDSYNQHQYNQCIPIVGISMQRIMHEICFMESIINGKSQIVESINFQMIAL